MRGRGSLALLLGGVVLAPAAAGALPCAPVPGLPHRCPVWTAAYSGPGGDDVAWAAALSPDGGTVYVTGWSQEPDDGAPGVSYDFATIAYDAATGDERWSARYNGTGRFFDVATALAVDPLGRRVYVTGYSYGTTYDYATIAYDATSGTQLWRVVYKGPGAGTDEPKAIAASPDGSTVFVTGAAYVGASGQDAVTVAYDSATGATLWTWAMAGERAYPDAGIAIAPDPDGRRVYVAADLGPESDRGILVGAFGSSGEGGPEGPRELWRATYQGMSGNTDRPTDLTVAPSGLVVVTGEGHASATLGDVLTIAYDTATGKQAWQARYDGAGMADAASAIDQSPDGSTIFVAGSSQKPGATFLTWDTDAVVLAYEASTGARRWVSRIDGETRGDDFGVSLGVGADGSRLYVAGAAHNVPSGAFGVFYDIVTTALGASDGSTLWRGRLDSGDQDVATAIAVGPNRVHVAGTSFSPLTGYDFATVTYAS